MEHKPICVDGVDVSGCIFYQANFEEDFDVKIKHFCSNWHNSCESINNRSCYYKQLTHKTQECEELKEYYNKCCQEFEKEKQDLINKYNQLSKDFYNGKYCNEENCNLLKAKEQECNKLYIQLKADEEYHKEEENTLRKIIKNKEERNIELYKENNQLKVNNEKMSKGYAKLTEIVSPYIDDFTGYNEKLGGFDIVLCVKELMEQPDQLKQILAKIKEICNNNDELQGDFNLVDCDKYKLGKHNLANKILQKISEVE